MKRFYLTAAVTAAALALPALPALAQTTEITIGITTTTTGPGAALGIPERNALEFVPKEIGGVPLKVIVLDDGGDPTTATTNARRFVTESKADIIMGSALTPPTIAVSNVANEAGIPHFGLAPFPITPERMKWSVAMPQPIPIMGKVLYQHMKSKGVKTVGYIGYSDSYGDLWFNDFKAQGVPMGMTLADEERFARPDTSVTGQVLKLVAANPDAILVGASGTAAALPQTELRERGYQGLIYQTHGAASMDFIRIAGKAAEGVLMASGPVMDPEDQPDEAATKKPGLALNSAYEGKYGPNSRSQFAGHSYDAFEILKRVIPTALKTAKPRHAGIPRSNPPGTAVGEGNCCKPGRLQFHRKGPLRPRRPLAHPADGEERQVHAGEVDAAIVSRRREPAQWAGSFHLRSLSGLRPPDAAGSRRIPDSNCPSSGRHRR
ncbi:branched-chain amino acid transport system substrate-binding protein [Bradyrhizobium sp. LM6.9]